MTQLIETIFRDEMTQAGLAALREQHANVVIPDLSQDDAAFKALRKVRTERNKIVEAVDRRRKDFNGEVKEYADGIISAINDIFDAEVTAFEIEEQRRKDEAARLKRIEDEKIAESRKKVAEINQFYSQCIGKDSEYIEGMIESVDLIEVDSFHKEVIHEAIEAKKVTLANLTQLLSDTRAREKLAAEEEALAAEREKLAAEKAEFEAWKAQQADAKAKPEASAPQQEVTANEAPEVESEPEAKPAQYLGHPGSKKPDTAKRKLSMMEINGIINFVSSITASEETPFSEELQRRADDYIQQHSSEAA